MVLTLTIKIKAYCGQKHKTGRQSRPYHVRRAESGVPVSAFRCDLLLFFGDSEADLLKDLCRLFAVQVFHKSFRCGLVFRIFHDRRGVDDGLV